MTHNITVYRVEHDGNRVLFSDLVAAQRYASTKTHGGQPCRVSEAEIPAGSEELWNVDVTLGGMKRPKAAPVEETHEKRAKAVGRELSEEEADDVRRRLRPKKR